MLDRVEELDRLLRVSLVGRVPRDQRPAPPQSEVVRASELLEGRRLACARIPVVPLGELNQRDVDGEKYRAVVTSETNNAEYKSATDEAATCYRYTVA